MFIQGILKVGVANDWVGHYGTPFERGFEGSSQILESPEALKGVLGALRVCYAMLTKKACSKLATLH